MSNPSTQPGANGPLVDVDDLRDAGVQLSDDVNVPVIVTDYVLDDNDTQQCRYATADEVRSMYIDNMMTVSAVQPDVWTLEIDQEDVTFTYHNGQTYTVRIGNIDMDSGPAASRYYKSNDLVYPTDDGQNVLLNATTTPRIAGLRAWMHAEMLQRSEERLKMAELVNAFATIMGQYSGALSR
jgi:hypothetical protein